MKKMVLLILLSATVMVANTQESRKNVIYSYFEGQQPNSKINISMGRDAETGLTGQEFTIVIKNLTQHKLKVYGRYFANLVCGYTKDGNIEIELKPGESKGGSAYLFDVDGLTQTVQPEDCKAVNKNRIKSVGFQITSVTDATEWEQEKATQPPTNKSSASSVSTYGSSTTSGTSTTTNYSSRNTSTTNQNNSQAILNNLNRQLENNRNTYNNVSNGIQQLGNLLLENQQREQAERETERRRRQAAEEAEQQRKEEQRQREAEEREQQQQEQLRINEENRIKSENDEKQRDMQWAVDKQIIGDNLILNKKTSGIADNVKQVYYIVYERNYGTGEVSLKSYTLNKYSDGTWMLFNDVLNKIGFSLYFHSGGVGQLLGFYTTKKEAVDIINRIKSIAKIKKVDDSFIELTPKATVIADNSSSNEINAQSLLDKGYSLDTTGKYVEAMQHYQKAAALGNLWAQNNIGVLYENGNGVKQSHTEALKWYSKAAGSGLALAQRNLGDLYESGNGVKQSYTEAVKWYQKAAEQGDDEAQYRLGSIYTGRYAYAGSPGFTADFTEAVKWYQKAAEQENTDAMNALAGLYEFGNGVQQDYQKAVNLHKKAALQGHISSQIELGYIYAKGWDEAHPFVPVNTMADSLSRQEASQYTDTTASVSVDSAFSGNVVTGVPRNYTEAMKWYRMAADQGAYAAMIDIGAMYTYGMGVPMDTSIAADWYKKAVETGSIDAMALIARYYLIGYYGDKPNYPEAVKWYRKLESENYWPALVNLGWMYNKGLGVTKDSIMTNRYYKKAAEQGGTDAMMEIANNYNSGNPPDYINAFKWTLQAALKGNVYGAHNLAVMYENGEGTQKNINEAVKWYRIAAAKGFEAAKEALKRLGKPEKEVLTKKP
ncbi:MAG: tetratricopeptide repeat protein [Chitinophagaceae bacterium]